MSSRHVCSSQATALVLAAVLLGGCAPLPTPLDAMQPVVSPADWARGGQPAAPAATDVQPKLLWRAALAGLPDELWWNGDTMLAASLAPAALPWQDRYLAAFDSSGNLHWSRDLGSLSLLDAGVDGAGNAYLAAGASPSGGSIMSLSPSGQVRWTTPWQAGWPRSLRVAESGERTVVGFDGASGAFPGRLELLGPDGRPKLADISGRLTAFAGFPSADGRTILMGYEGAATGLYRNQLFRGIGVNLIGDGGQVRWSIINYHYPLALSDAGDLAVVAGLPTADRAYAPPPQDRDPVPPFGQLLWLDRGGQIVGRYRLPFAAGVRAFAMTPDGRASVLALTSHRFSAQAAPVTEQQLTWHDTAGRVVWKWTWEGDLVDLSLARSGSSLLVAERTAGPGDWLTLLDSSGKVFWRYHHPTAVQAVALSADGRFAAVLGADGLSYFETHIK